MTITIRGHHGLQAGTTAVSPSPPAGTTTDDVEVIWTCDKLSTTFPTSPPPTNGVGAWTLIKQGVIGTGADGAGTGPMLVSVWKRILTGTGVATTVSIPSGNVAMGGGVVASKSVGDPAWDITASLGTDSSSGTGFSATVADNLDLKVGEVLVSVGFFTAQTTLPGRGLTIPGVTSTLTGVDSGGTANGNDMFGWTDRRVSTAGTQSGASTTTGTSGAATTGGCVHIRIGLASGITQAISPAAETDTAQPLGRTKLKAIGITAETDAAHPVARSKRRALGIAAETGAAQLVARLKRRATGPSSESDAAQPVGRVKRKALGTALETDAAQLITHGGKAASPALETDTAVPVGRRKVKAIGTAVEADTASVLARVKRRVLAVAAEIEAAVSLARGKRRAAGTAVETSTARPVGRSKLLPVGVAAETNEAVTLGVVGGQPPLTLQFSTAVEPDRYLTSVEGDRYAGAIEPDRYTGGVET